MVIVVDPQPQSCLIDTEVPNTRYSALYDDHRGAPDLAYTVVQRKYPSASELMDVAKVGKVGILYPVPVQYL